MNNAYWNKILALLLFAIVVLLAILVYDNHVSKRGNSGDYESTEPVVYYLDSTETTTAEPAITEPAPEPEKAPANDYKWARVQGPVKSIKETIVTIEEYSKDTSYISYNFDQNGILIPDKSKSTKFTRDNLGQITKIVETFVDKSVWEDGPNGKRIYNKEVDTYTFKYNDDGYVTYQYHKYASDYYDPCFDHFYYTLNDKGRIVAYTNKSTGDGIFTIRATYTYSNEDQYGNWCKANVILNSTSDCCGSDKYKKIITRKITYWE